MQNKFRFLFLILLLSLSAACTAVEPQNSGPNPPPTAADQAAAVQTIPAASAPPTAEPLPPTTVPASETILLAADQARLSFTDVSTEAHVNMTHSTPILSGDGAQMISGAAAADFNNDGWTDLFVIGGGLEADAFYLNLGNGTFIDRAAAAGLGEPHLGSGTAVGDYNNDGWLDIYVTSFGTPGDMGVGRHRLYRNNGDSTFTDVAAQAGVNLASPELADGLGAAFGDYDLDGDLDLFVAGWRKPQGQPALGNRLFQNNGDGTFSDTTLDAGIVDDGFRGFNPCFIDMDGDRYPELLLAADFGTSQYFINKRDGTFQNHSKEMQIEQVWSGMGSTAGDLNNDGLPDWYITAIFDDDHVGRGDGAKLFMNQGAHTYQETAMTAGVADVGWGWGTVAVDLNLDGWLDLAAVNGWNLKSYWDESPKIWINDGQGSYAEVSTAVGLDEGYNALGLLNFDLDNDGDQDLFTTSYNNRPRLYRNDLPNEAAYLRVQLDTSQAPQLAPNGYGSRVIATINGQEIVRIVDTCAHYLTQSEPIVHFGLGAAAKIDELRVEWSDGSQTLLPNVPVNQLITLSPD